MSGLDLVLGLPSIGAMTEQFLPVMKPLPFTKKFQVNEETANDLSTYLWEKQRNDQRLAGAREVDADAYVEVDPNRRVVRTGLLHFAVKERLDPKKMFLTSAPGALMSRNAEEYVARAVKRNISRLHRAIEYASARVLQDAAGVVIDAANTAFPVGSVEINETLTVDGGLQQSTAGASWDVDTTKIITGPNQLTAFVQALADAGFGAGQIFLARAKAAALSNNLEAQTWLSTAGGFNVDFYQKMIAAFANNNAEGRQGEYVEGGSVLNGLGNIPYWHVVDHVYRDRNNAAQRFLDTTRAVILPSDEVIRETDALCYVKGPSIVPDGPSVVGAEGAADAYRLSDEIVSYVWRDSGDVPGLWVVSRVSCLPLVKNEQAVRAVTGI